MVRLTRRQFLKSAGGGAVAVAGLAGCRTGAGEIAPTSARRVVVVGGGWGGATAAKYVRMADPTIEVVLLEPNKTFVSCPFSNLVLSGVRKLPSLTFDYDGLRARGVTLRHEPALAIDADQRRVRVDDGYLAYERLILSPGVDFQWEQVEGLPAAQDTVLHAWKAGPQTLALAKQLRDLPEGGVVVMTVPPVAYRCPPGPYERASVVADYFKQAKPRSKVLVLDANPDVSSKGPLFKRAWSDLYPGIIEYRGNSRAVGVDGSSMSVRRVMPSSTLSVTGGVATAPFFTMKKFSADPSATWPSWLISAA